MYSATWRGDGRVTAGGGGRRRAEEGGREAKGAKWRTHVQRRGVAVVEAQSVEHFSRELDVFAHMGPKEGAVLGLVSVSAWMRCKFTQRRKFYKKGTCDVGKKSL